MVVGGVRFLTLSISRKSKKVNGWTKCSISERNVKVTVSHCGLWSLNLFCRLPFSWYNANNGWNKFRLGGRRMSLHKQSSSVTTGSSSSSSENPFSKEPTYYLREMEISLFRSFIETVRQLSCHTLTGSLQFNPSVSSRCSKPLVSRSLLSFGASRMTHFLNRFWEN